MTNTAHLLSVCMYVSVRLFPSCGFSNTAVSILNNMRVPYETVDVLADERMRYVCRCLSLVVRHWTRCVFGQW